MTTAKIQQVPIAAPSLDTAEIDVVTEVLRSGRLSEGERTAAFEQAFAEAEGAAWGVATSSGTAALLCAYMATVPAGEEVLVPGFGFIATAAMVVAAGAVPVFCDVDPETFTILPEEIERRGGERTRAAVPMHLFGNPGSIGQIEEVCRAKGVRIIWDAAQAHGATYNERPIGSFPLLTCYSFDPSQNMTTGEGGMVLGHDESLRAKLQRFKDHGQEGRYHHRVLGYNFRSNEVAAAIGLAQLAKLPAFNAARQGNAARLTEKLAGLEGLRLPRPTEGATHVYQQYTLSLDLHRLSVDRDAFARRLADRGIATGVHYPLATYLQPAMSEYDRGAALPNCIDLSRRVLSIPVHPGLSDEDVDRVASAVAEVHDEALR